MASDPRARPSHRSGDLLDGRPEHRLFADWLEATGRDPALALAGDPRQGAKALLSAYVTEVPGSRAVLVRRLRAARDALEVHLPPAVPFVRPLALDTPLRQLAAPGDAPEQAAPSAAPSAAGDGSDPAVESPVVESPPWEPPRALDVGELAELLGARTGRGWPHGFTEARDDWLLCLLATETDGGAGLRRQQIRALKPGHLALDRDQARPVQVTITPPPAPTGHGPVTLGRTTSTDACPTCVALRWLHLLGTSDFWGRSSVRAAVMGGYGPTLAAQPGSRGHLCELGEVALAGLLKGYWRAAPWLCMPIDQWGGTAMTPLSERTITEVVARRREAVARRAAGLPAQDAPTAGEVTDTTNDPGIDPGDTEQQRRLGHLTDDELMELLDAAVAAADEVNKRVREHT